MRRVQGRIEITPVIFFLVFFGTLALDQGVKRLLETYPETTGTFFRLTENSGLVFSIPLSRTLIWIMLIAVLFFLLILSVRSIMRGRLAEIISFALLLGGGVSNGMDRLRVGAVHDTFALPGGLLFNLADIAIIVGVFLFVCPPKFLHCNLVACKRAIRALYRRKN